MSSLTDKYLMPDIKNAARVLEVKLPADQASIKLAYKQKLKKTHPDLVRAQSEDEPTESISEVIKAYEVLKDYAHLREKLAGEELRNELQDYISLYKLLLKKYTRRLSHSKFQLCNLENRSYILSYQAQLLKNYSHLKDYSEYKLTRQFLEDLTRFHYLPLNLTIKTVQQRKGYHLYRKVIRLTTWTLEETFSSLNGTKNKINLWRDYLSQIESHYEALKVGDHREFIGKVGFIPRMLKTITALTEVFADYQAILSISDYMQMLYAKPKRHFLK